MTPKQVIEAALRYENVDEAGARLVIQPRPGLSTAGIDGLEASLPGSLPSEIRELLSFSAGLDFDLTTTTPCPARSFPAGTSALRSRACEIEASPEFVFFAGDIWESGIKSLVRGLEIARDGCGNSWVLEIDAESGAWGPVFFVSRDPRVIVLQARSLAEFLAWALFPDVPPSAGVPVRGAEWTIWRAREFGSPRSSSSSRANDEVLDRFCTQLGSHHQVIDM